MLELGTYPLERIAERVGTPFWLYDGDAMRRTVDSFARLVGTGSAAAAGRVAGGTAGGRVAGGVASGRVAGGGLAGRYAMKANAARPVLDLVRHAGLWLDATSGNEVLRARRAGFPGGVDPPVIMLTSDVYRDNALDVVLRERVMPNVGSPGMIEELRRAGYLGPIGVRVNPGFGHGAVESCDTGGPSSKHGIWPDALELVRAAAHEAKLSIVTLHAHIGTGPELPEFSTNLRRLMEFFAALLPAFPQVHTVNLGGGIPHPYRLDEPAYDLSDFRPLLDEAVGRLSRTAGRPIRVEIEPGRFLVAGSAVLVTRVHEVKVTRRNEKGEGHAFVMVDAGFCDLVRPAMYGSYHHMDVVGRGATHAAEPCVVAGPLCESGDVFTRSEQEFLEPRMLPRPEPRDLLVLQDAGAYGTVMSSNYLSMGRAPEVWWEGGSARLVSRRERLEDIVARECDEAI